MHTKEKILEIVENENVSDFIKRLQIASIISQDFAEQGTTAVMVGGSAVEFYTWASYATQDVDFIVDDPRNIKKVMEQLGFENHSAVWELSETNIIIEFPSGPLDASYEKLTQINTAVGKLSIIGIEDIIIDRSARTQYWGDSDEWAKYMIMAHHDKLDWEYLKEKAVATSCLETLMHFKKYYKKELGDISEQNPKRKLAISSSGYQERINEILSFTDIPVKISTSNKDLFNIYAKKILSAESIWTFEKNLILVKNMLQDHIDTFKIKKSLSYSPSFVGLSSLEKMIKSKEIWNIVEKDPEIKKLNNTVER